MEFLSDTEKSRVQSVIEAAQHSKQQAQNPLSAEEFFIPIIPPRCIELEVAAEDNTMWRILSINHPPPISIAMWIQWSGITTADLVIYRRHAIKGTFFSKIHILSEK